MMEILYVVVSFVLGIVIGFLIKKASSDVLRNKVDNLNAQLLTEKDSAKMKIADLQSQMEKHESSSNGQISALKTQYDKILLDTKLQYEQQLEKQRAMLDSQLADSQRLYESQLEEQRVQHEKHVVEMKSAFESRLSSSAKQYEGQLLGAKEQYETQLDELKLLQTKQLEQQLTLIKEQMNSTSEKILKERSEQLKENNNEQLSAILNPLINDIVQMRNAVEKSGKEHAETMVRLDATIKTSIEQSREVGERADKLAQALTGENKTQGNFGELRLKQMLEDMGFEEGTQFEEQSTMREDNGRTIYDETDGHRMIPDVILHFPDKRDVIIDSKMSFKAFEDYHNAQTEEQRQDALKRHVLSVRRHVDELSRKNYSSYIAPGRGKLDFVLMYVFSESALQLATASEPGLWKSAYDKGVIICGSQNLYIMLRVLEMTWRQMRQLENQEDMMKAANAIIDRVQLFYERFAKVEEMLDKTKQAFDEVKSVSSPKGQSICVAANKLIKYGAKENPKRKCKLRDMGSPQNLEGEETIG